MTSSSGNQPFILSATVDFPDDVRYGRYNTDRLEEMMDRLKGMGVSRIYWLYYGDVDPGSNWAVNIFQRMQYGQDAIGAFGEPIKAAVPLAHKRGIELYGVLKPYNTGTSRSTPEGSPDYTGQGLQRIGGEVVDAIPFTVNHQNTRMKRRRTSDMEALQSAPITKIKLYKADDSPTRVGAENLEIWTSANNYQYQHQDFPLEVVESVEPSPKEVVDYYGDVVTAKGAPVRTLTLEGLNLTDKYVLVSTSITEGEPDFINTAVGMIEANGADGEPLPIVVATRSGMGHTTRNFRDEGLDFDNGFGPQQFFLDVENGAELPHKDRGNWWRQTSTGGAIAFARGVNEYIPATPCEVYPEVRELWDGWVDRILDAGVDGLDIRVSHHGSLVNEPYEYGFNEPVIEEFVKRHGYQPTDSEEDMSLLSKLRGEHFTDFIQDTSTKVRAKGKKMQVHLHTEAFRDDACHGQMMGFPANIYFDWKRWLNDGMVDGITLRTSWFEALESPSEDQAFRARLSYRLDDPVVEDALETAKNLGIPAYLNRYVDRAIGIDEYVEDLETTFHDDRFAGFDVYEFAHLARPVPDGSKLEEYRGRIGIITEKARELGLV